MWCSGRSPCPRARSIIEATAQSKMSSEVIDELGHVPPVSHEVHPQRLHPHEHTISWNVYTSCNTWGVFLRVTAFGAQTNTYTSQFWKKRRKFTIHTCGAL
eukprot:4360172-Amphidinium_carterae.1